MDKLVVVSEDIHKALKQARIDYIRRTGKDILLKDIVDLVLRAGLDSIDSMAAKPPAE